MICEFKGPYDFLSNFYPKQILMDGLIYPSVEHAYQAAKTVVTEERFPFISDLSPTGKSISPGEAKRRGKKLVLRESWDLIKLDVMHGLLLHKFADQPFRGWLKNTAPQELIEGNTWGDTFWGICNGQGENHLGKLLMKVRQGL